MNNWKETTLGKITTKVIDNRGKTPPIIDSGYEILEVNAISQDKREPDYSKVTKFVDEGIYKSWFRNGHIKEADILIPTVGTIGNVSFSMQNRGSIAQNLIALRINDKNYPLFVYYKMKSPSFKKQILNLDIGGVQPSVKVPHLLAQEILLPELEEQKQIAGVLSSLDDKIELLRAENVTLEKIAQGIFKEWFVNFTIDGKKLKLENGIPEGWRTGNLGEAIELFDSKRVPLASDVRAQRKGKYPYYGATSIMDYIDDYLFDGTYLLLAEDGSVIDEKGHPILQYVQGQFWVSNHSHVLQGKNRFSTEILYVLLRRANVAGIVNGAVQLKINKTNLINFEILIPPKNILESFDSILQPIFNKSKNNNYQIQVLSRLRDTLLPKLMSGEIRLFDKDDDICNNDKTGFQKKSKKLSEERKTVKKIKEGKQTLKERHQKLQETTLELTKEGKDDNLKVEVDGLKFISSSASSFRGKTRSDVHVITGNFSGDFFILKKEIELALKKIKKGQKNKKDSQYKRFDINLDNPDAEKLKETSLKKFLNKKSENIEKICLDILNNKYTLDPYFGFLKNKGKGKFRPILAPSIKDKIVFTWVLNKIKEEFLFLKNYNIFGSYPNKRKIIEILADVSIAAKKYGYILKVDIESFYPSIRRDRLLLDLKRESRIRDEYFLKIIGQALENKINPKNKKDEKHFPTSGIPQGCAFSPLLANYYAYKIDKYLKDQKLISFRYLDDLIIFVKNPSEARRVFVEIERLFKGRGLKLHPLGRDKDKSYIVSADETFEYLGVEIEKDSFKIPDKKINQVNKTVKLGILNKGTTKLFKKEDILEKLENYISGWKNYYSLTCREHYFGIRMKINKELECYYERFPEIIEISNKKYYI